MDDEMLPILAEEIYRWYMEQTTKDVWKPYDRLSFREKEPFEELATRLLTLMDEIDDLDDLDDDDELVGDYL